MSVRLPGSDAPFKPMNPWGRPMPAPKREMRTAPPSLYQVHVETHRGVVAVGPKAGLQQAEQFCEAISTMIARGKEKAWSNPTIVEFASN